MPNWKRKLRRNAAMYQAKSVNTASATAASASKTAQPLVLPNGNTIRAESKMASAASKVCRRERAKAAANSTR